MAKWSNLSVKDFESNPKPSIVTTERISIADLDPSQGFVNVLGIIIGKWNSRKFTDRNGNVRSCFSFMLRDSPSFFIYVTYWGTPEDIEQVNSIHKIGDLVELLCAQIIIKTEDFNEFKFKPPTPTPYHLSVKVKQGQLVLLHQNYGVSEGNVDGVAQNFNDFRILDPILMRCPTKAPDDFYSVAEIQINGDNLSAMDNLNVVALVKRIYGSKSFTVKGTHEVRDKCDILLCDERGERSIFVTAWEKGLIEWIQKWSHLTPLVVFLSDVKVKYDSFKKQYGAHSTAKTVVTFDPDVPELREKFSKIIGQSLNGNFENGAFEEEDESRIDTTQYQTILTVAQVHEIILGKKGPNRTENGSITDFYQKPQPKGTKRKTNSDGHLVENGARKSETFVNDVLTCTVVAYLSFFDVDSDSMEDNISWKCEACGNKVNGRNWRKNAMGNKVGQAAYEIPSSFSMTQGDICKNPESCPNPYCPTVSRQTSMAASLTPIYDTAVHIGDYTGTLKACHLTPVQMRSMTGFGEEKFMRAETGLKTQIKWKYLFEPYNFLIKISFEGNRKPQIRVVKMIARPESS